MVSGVTKQLLARNPPHPGTIYRVRGEPMLYIRTEHRAGRPEPEHLFVKQDRRTVFSVWTATMPPDAELIVDERGRREANEERWLRLAAEHNIEILFGLLRQACEWLPRERAQELRRRYAAAQPS